MLKERDKKIIITKTKNFIHAFDVKELRLSDLNVSDGPVAHGVCTVGINTSAVKEGSIDPPQVYIEEHPLNSVAASSPGGARLSHVEFVTVCIRHLCKRATCMRGTRPQLVR